MRVVVIGAVAAGMSAASQARRRDASAEVIVLEGGHDVSYGACGMPYNLSDPARDIDDLVVMTAAEFREARGIDLRTGHTVTAVDTAAKTVAVTPEGAPPYTLGYDKLIFATGARAFVPPLEGVDLEGVFVLRSLRDGARLKAALAGGGATRAVILGGGYIGLEMAESLTLRGLAVTLVEQAPTLLPGFEAPIVKRVAETLAAHGVAVHTGARVSQITRGDGGLTVHTDAARFEADLVLVAVGVRPNSALAEGAAIALGARGAIAVNARCETSAPDVYAAGDCAESLDRVSGQKVWVPLGTTANKQGKVAGANAVGADTSFAGIVSTAAFKVFELEVGRTGMGRSELSATGREAQFAASNQGSRASSYGHVERLDTVLCFDPDSGRLLGAQMAGREGVAGRINVFATALSAAMTLDDVASLDLAYAPPLAPVYDPVLIAAAVAQKAREGRRG
ncbi:MAG: FAD-dependent oxidoreductase [Myxococcales bacterium]|nr:FAD-dependent oxidoreductase [Myxococcales bacterium]